MVGALSVVDSHHSPCLCLDTVLNNSNASPYNMSSVKNGLSGDLVLQRSSVKRKQPKMSMELTTSFVDSWHDSRLSWRSINVIGKTSRNYKKDRRQLVVVSELAGQYEDSFEDVKTQMLNYFTYKAVRTVLNQLYEMNPTQYRWFYDFVATNNPGDGKRFLRNLGKEKQDLAERVMVTRLHLYGKWVKKCNHDEIYKQISDQNLELMRERLMETVIWPSDDTNTEKIG